MKNIRVFERKLIHVRKRHKYVMRVSEWKGEKKARLLKYLNL